jgi:penicillin-insensitive murein endopeptidase
VVLTGLSQRAVAAPSHSVSSTLLTDPHLRQGQSVGSPTDGHLLGGSRLADAPYLRFLPVYASDDARWGLGTLVSMVDRSARTVRKQFPDAVLSVGQLSRRGGGDIDRHASHESGRDADLSFYIRDQAHKPLYSDHMVSFRGDGTAPTWPGAFFDDARNWALVHAILQEDHARVTYIFVSAPIRARLLAYAARSGVSQALLRRAAELMVQPHGVLPHDDHFHVRIGCPAGMSACVELPTHNRLAHAGGHHHTAPARVDPPRVVARRAAPTTKPVAVVVRHPAQNAPEHAPEPPADRAPPPAPVEPSAPPAAPAVAVVPFDDVDGPAEAPASKSAPPQVR